MESSVRNAANLTKVPPTYLDVLILKAKVQLVGPLVGPLPLRWMDEMTRILTSNLQQYLLGRCILQRADIIDPEPGYIEFTKIHDNDIFGWDWDNLVEGRVARVPQTFKPVLISQQYYIKHTSSWARVGLMRQLLILTHQATTMAIMRWNNLECSPFEYQTSIIIIPLIFIERDIIVKWKYISLKTTG